MYALLDQLVGSPQVGMNIGAVNQNPPLTPPGIFVTAVDPWWGAGEFIYGYANGTIREMGLCVMTPSFQAAAGTNYLANQWRWDMTEVANTANQGRPLCVALQPMVAGQLGWFLVAGICPVNSNAAVAAGAIGIAAAGQAGANSAGKQILDGVSLASSANTVAKANCTGLIGSFQIQVPSSDGWFPGVFLSGTGVAAASKVVSVDGSGRFVTVNNALTANVAGTVTATYNNATIFYNVVHLMRGFAQGAIT